MTKQQLIQILEPFADDIDIISLNEEDYPFHLIPYFSTFYGNEGKIILSSRTVNKKNTVELRMK